MSEAQARPRRLLPLRQAAAPSRPRTFAAAVAARTRREWAEAAALFAGVVAADPDVGLDGEAEAMKRFGFSGVPTGILLDGEGRIVEVGAALRGERLLPPAP